MRNKPKIVFVGNYNRTDYVRLLEASKDYCEFCFLFFTSPHEELNTYYRNYGHAIYWEDFTSAQELLKQIQPDKVVFLYVESYNHVVLNLACREAGVPTYLLEHGLRADYVYGFDPVVSPSPKPSLKTQLLYYRNLTHDFSARLRSRRFLTNSVKQLQPDNNAFVQEFISIRRQHNYLGTFRALHSDKRLTDYYISFSPKQFEAFKDHEAPYFGGKPLFIGVPYFDDLATTKSGKQEHAILFIDQPLAEQGLLQWTPEYKKKVTTQLATIAEKFGYKLYVKLHPAQQHGYWQPSENLQLINDTQLREICGNIPIVMGFYSTYLMPITAFEHTTLITLENHPADKLDVSKPFIEAGVAHPVYSLDELPEVLENTEQLHQKQLPHKKRFEKDWLYKFDGKAGERLRVILLSPNIT